MANNEALKKRAAAVLPSLTHLDTSRLPPGLVGKRNTVPFPFPPQSHPPLSLALCCLQDLYPRVGKRKTVPFPFPPSSLPHHHPFSLTLCVFLKFTTRFPCHRYPQFISHGDGCKVVDVDGNTYIDYMASFGPILLGHRNAVVDAAVEAQQQRGDCLAGPTEKMVELAERLVAAIPWSSWTMFAKNGGDATAIAVRVARARTRKRVILRAPGSYHGSNSIWREGSAKSLMREGVPAEHTSHSLPYTFNDLASVKAAMDRAGDDLAAIIIAAFRWDYATPAEIATSEFLKGVRSLCDERGAALICDDVRSSMRIHVQGTWADPRYGHGVEPDLTCLCKGIANGHPLSAVVGRAGWRKAARGVVATGSFWANAVPFAAALAVLPLVTEAASSAEQCGIALRVGLARQAAVHGLSTDFMQTGPPQMPYFSFKSEAQSAFPERELIMEFCSVCVMNGCWFHPFHTMFLNGAHTQADIEATLQVTATAFAHVAAIKSRANSKL